MYNTNMANLLLTGSIIMIMIVLISLSSNVAYFHSKNHRAPHSLILTLPQIPQ